jgi:GHH signature containing HNH/Endo VII superfamily nuclease toxin  2/Domain of unknown function (DUF4150)
VMLKNKSYFKTSYGDEAGCAAKKGVVTSVNRGKIYFIAWAMDVKVEGENVVRHLDMTTHNHASPASNTATWTYADRMSMAPKGTCRDERTAVKEKCGSSDQKAKCPDTSAVEKAEAARDATKKGSRARSKAKAAVKKAYEDFAAEIAKDPCQVALRCFMSPYEPSTCCPKQTPDHVIDAASFLHPDSDKPRNDRRRRAGWANYDVNAAACVCAEGPNQTTATHGELSIRRGVVAQQAARKRGGMWSRADATKAAVKAVKKTFPASNCSPGCLEAQLNAYHDTARTDPDEPEKQIKASYSMDSTENARVKARLEMDVTVSSR